VLSYVLFKNENVLLLFCVSLMDGRMAGDKDGWYGMGLMVNTVPSGSFWFTSAEFGMGVIPVLQIFIFISNHP
jgi:hypothetical protein